MRWESWLLRLALAGLAVFQVVTGNPQGALVAAEGAVVSLIPRAVERLSDTRIPRSMEALFVARIALQFVSGTLKLFELFTYWDKIIHPTLAALTAWLSAWLLLGYRDAILFTGLVIDRGWPALPDGVTPGQALAWSGLDQPGTSAVVSGDWVPDAE